MLSYVESGLGPSDDPYRARLLLGELGLTVRRAAAAPVPATAWQGRLRQTRMCSSDEPTNHLDIQVIEWLEKRLGGMRSALLLISHDRRFLSNLSRSTVWVDRGATRTISIGFGSFEAWRDLSPRKNSSATNSLARSNARLIRFATVSRRAASAMCAASAELQAMRERRSGTRSAAPGQAKLEPVDVPLSGKLVIEAKGLSKAFDGKAVVDEIRHANSSRRPRRMCCPNGAGKTTLLNMLIGKLEAGRRRAGLGPIRRSPAWAGAGTPEPVLEDVADGLTAASAATFLSSTARQGASGGSAVLSVPARARAERYEGSFGGERARLVLAGRLLRPALLVLAGTAVDLEPERRGGLL